MDTNNEQELIEEWRTKRLGKVTASSFGKLVKKGKDGFKLSTGKVAEGLMYKIAWERLLLDGNLSNGLGRLEVTAKAIEHGNDYEGAAILRYQEVTGNEVDYVNKFIEDGEFLGGTPDGYIGDDGIIEVKCPWNGGNHLYTLLERKLYNDEHMYQIQGYLMLTGRKWCHFATYDPDLNESVNLAWIDIERDETIINGIKEVMQEVIKKIKSINEHKLLK